MLMKEFGRGLFFLENSHIAIDKVVDEIPGNGYDHIHAQITDLPSDLQEGLASRYNSGESTEILADQINEWLRSQGLGEIPPGFVYKSPMSRFTLYRPEEGYRPGAVANFKPLMFDCGLESAYFSYFNTTRVDGLTYRVNTAINGGRLRHVLHRLERQGKLNLEVPEYDSHLLEIMCQARIERAR